MWDTNKTMQWTEIAAAKTYFFFTLGGVGWGGELLRVEVLEYDLCWVRVIINTVIVI
jgi:hypothetical protein